MIKNVKMKEISKPRQIINNKMFEYLKNLEKYHIIKIKIEFVLIYIKSIYNDPVL